MNRIFLLLLPLILWLEPLKAQRFSIGPEGGVAITDVSGANLVYPGHATYHKFGLDVGGIVDYRATKNSFLQLELRYIQKGSQVPPDTSGIGTANANPNGGGSYVYFGDYYQLRLNYIDVAFSFKHNLNIVFNKSPTRKFAIEGGISFGELVGYAYTVESTATSTDLNTLDISLFAGFDYNFSQHVYIDFRYNNSIIPAIAQDNTNSVIYPYYSSWNRGNNLAFTITFGVLFGGSGLPTDNNDSNTPPSKDKDQ